jgi:hypothetical protein
VTPVLPKSPAQLREIEYEKTMIDYVLVLVANATQERLGLDTIVVKFKAAERLLSLQSRQAPPLALVVRLGEDDSMSL